MIRCTSLFLTTIHVFSFSIGQIICATSYLNHFWVWLFAILYFVNQLKRAIVWWWAEHLSAVLLAEVDDKVIPNGLRLTRREDCVRHPVLSVLWNDAEHVLLSLSFTLLGRPSRCRSFAFIDHFSSKCLSRPICSVSLAQAASKRRRHETGTYLVKQGLCVRSLMV